MINSVLDNPMNETYVPKNPVNFDADNKVTLLELNSDVWGKMVTR